MLIRNYEHADLRALIDLTIETFRPLFEQYLPTLISPAVLDHDHGHWQADYEAEVPSLHDPSRQRFITVAECDGAILGYVGWQVNDTSSRLEMVAVHPRARRQGVADALCRHVLDELKQAGAVVVHIGTGGTDQFHAPARELYESLGFTGLPVMDYTKAL